MHFSPFHKLQLDNLTWPLIWIYYSLERCLHVTHSSFGCRVCFGLWGMTNNIINKCIGWCSYETNNTQFSGMTSKNLYWNINCMFVTFWKCKTWQMHWHRSTSSTALSRKQRPCGQQLDRVLEAGLLVLCISKHRPPSGPWCFHLHVTAGMAASILTLFWHQSTYFCMFFTWRSVIFFSFRLWTRRFSN